MATIILPFLKVFRIGPNRELMSLHAAAPWAKRTYQPRAWNEDERGIWVSPLWGTGIFEAVTEEHPDEKWQVWVCYGTIPFRPLYTAEALSPWSTTPPPRMKPFGIAMAVKKLLPIMSVLSSHEVKSAEQGRELLAERLADILKISINLPTEVK